MLFVGVEIEMREPEFIEHAADEADVVRRAQAVSTTALEIARTSETSLQTAHEDSILAWQHLVLHRCETSGKHLGLVRTIVLAGLRRLCTSRIDDPDDVVLFGKHIHRQLAQTVICHRAICMNAMQICARNFFITYHILQIKNKYQHITQIV